MDFGILCLQVIKVAAGRFGWELNVAWKLVMSVALVIVVRVWLLGLKW